MYMTEYQNMVVNDSKLNSDKFGPDQDKAQERQKRELYQERSIDPYLSTITSYLRDYGAYGEAPLEKYKDVTKQFQTEKSSTVELDKGTQRVTKNPPGYTGFIPESQYNNDAFSQAYREKARENMKNKMLLFHLDQYPRTFLPGYQGYKTQATVNIKGADQIEKPTTQTTYGEATTEGAKYFNNPKFSCRDTSNFIDSTKGIMTFFNQGGDFQSDNGVANAQKFFKVVRPLEGLENVKLHIPSKVNRHGSKFFN